MAERIATPKEFVICELLASRHQRLCFQGSLGLLLLHNGNVHRAAANIIVSKSRAARGSVCNVLLSRVLLLRGHCQHVYLSGNEDSGHCKQCCHENVDYQ